MINKRFLQTVSLIIASCVLAAVATKPAMAPEEKKLKHNVFGRSWDGMRLGMPGAPAKKRAKGELRLTPNTAYIESDVNNLRINVDRERIEERPLGHGFFRDEVAGFIEDGSALVWGVSFNKAGAITLSLGMDVLPAQAGKKLLVGLVAVDRDNNRKMETKQIITTKTGAKQAPLRLNVPRPGFYEIKLLTVDRKATATKKELKDTTSSLWVGDFKYLTITGRAADGAVNCTLRYPRTNAAHAGLHSSKDPKEIVLAVMEVRNAAPTQPGQYHPITTPSGYFGSPWDNVNKTFRGINFSHWSGTQHSKEGNIPYLSRLTAYRAGTKYTTFGHEGIGVKPMSPNPWSSMKPTNRQVLAIHMVPSLMLETFTDSFLNLDTDKWELFGQARRLNKNTEKDVNNKKLRWLDVGHFLEVTYRSPQIHRESHVRGWYMTRDGSWYQADTMSSPRYTVSTMSHRDRGITDDGWFYLSTGGWWPNQFERQTYTLPKKFIKTAGQRPNYLKGKMLESLLSLPIVITDKPAKPQSTRVEISFSIDKGELDGTGALYYGVEDKATFCHDMNSRGYDFVKKWQWEKYKNLTGLKLGLNRVTLAGLKPNTKYFYRIRVHGKKYTVFNNETQNFETK